MELDDGCLYYSLDSVEDNFALIYLHVFLKHLTFLLKPPHFVCLQTLMNFSGQFIVSFTVGRILECRLSCLTTLISQVECCYGYPMLRHCS